MQGERYYKERDITRREILQGEIYYKERDITRRELLQGERYYWANRAHRICKEWAGR